MASDTVTDMPGEVTPGLDLSRLRPWLREVVPDDHLDTLTAEVIAGGKSNLTYRLSDGVSSWILRRPPLGHVLATAHDMGREFRVMSALAPTNVPVPRMIAQCPDDEVIGAPFYVMEAVVGTPFRRAEEFGALGQRRARAISTDLIDTLVTLHAVDPHEVGLGDFGRPEAFLTRQVARWQKQLKASASRELPAADELHRRLAALAPEVDAVSVPGIVHGDYRLDNVLVDTTDGSDVLRAILDWEMATVADPITDLAILLFYGRLASLAGGSVVSDVSLAPGYLGEPEIIDRYAAGSSRDVSHLGFYLGLAGYKLAAILEGIHYRYLGGQTVGAGFDRLGDAIHPLLDAALSSLDDETYR